MTGILSKNYADLERRVLAHEQQGEDYMTTLAARRFGVAYWQVTPEQRQAVKAEQFVLTYGHTGRVGNR